MKIKSPRIFREWFKQQTKSRNNEFNDPHFIGADYNGDIAGFFSMYHGEKSDIRSYLRKEVEMAEDGQAIYAPQSFICAYMSVLPLKK